MTSLLEKGRAGVGLGEYEVIDFHGHLGRYFFGIPEVSAGSVVATMDRAGVKQIFVSSLECTGIHAREGNDEVREAMRKFPGRFLGYAVVWPESAKAVGEEIENRLGEGFSGIKLHISNGFDYTRAEYAPAWEIADERRLPVLVHTWGVQGGLSQVEGLARKYRGANIVLAHSATQQVEEYMRLAREHENVYLDLCGSNCEYGMVEKLAKEGPLEKLLWGSDAVFINMAQQVGKVLGAKISEDAKKRILSTNAKRVLGMVRK